MSTTGSTIVLRPVLLFSRFSGTLPFDFVADKGRVQMLKSSFVWFACFVYSITAYIRDAKYIFGTVVIKLAFSSNITSSNIIAMCHDTSFHIFIISVFVTTFCKFSDFVILFDALFRVEKFVVLENPRRIRNSIVFFLVVINTLDILEQGYANFVQMRKAPGLDSIFTRVLASIVRCSQNSTDFEFGSISFVVYKLFQQLNKDIEKASTKLTAEKANHLRSCFSQLHLATDILNRLYGPCLLFSLCVKGLACQHELYLTTIVLYDAIVMGSLNAFKLLNNLRWFITNIYRIIIFVWISSSITAEVRNLATF
jgi:hypothetical protein